LLAVQHRRQQEREDRRAALGAWILVNVNRDSEKKREPFSLEEVTAWLGYGHQYVQSSVETVPPLPAAQTPEEITRGLQAVYTLHTLTSDGGTREG
jgi:hypothetical protein